MATRITTGFSVVIFANGLIDPTTPVAAIVAAAGMVIAADGGADTLQRLGLRPDLIIGDMDSVSPDCLAEYERQGVAAVRFPKHKDKTDLELAIENAAARGATEIILLGALGARLDMSVSSILLLAAGSLTTVPLRIMDGPYEASVITGECRVAITGRRGDLLSLLPVGGAACGITLENLEYPLLDEDLPMGSTRGISNIFTGETACVSLRQGRLLCIHTRQESL